jgi:hypothetical protein
MGKTDCECVCQIGEDSACLYSLVGVVVLSILTTIIMVFLANKNLMKCK